MIASLNVLFSNILNVPTGGYTLPAAEQVAQIARGVRHLKPNSHEPQCPECLEPLRICNCGMVDESCHLPPKSLLKA